MDSYFTAPYDLETAQQRLNRLDMRHIDALPIDFWPARAVRFERVDHNRIASRIHKRVGRFCYASVNGQMKRQEEGQPSVSFSPSISYRGLVYIIPTALIGIFFLLQSNIGGFLVLVAVAAINLGWAYFYGSEEIASEIKDELAVRHKRAYPQI